MPVPSAPVLDQACHCDHLHHQACQGTIVSTALHSILHDQSAIVLGPGTNSNAPERTTLTVAPTSNASSHSRLARDHPMV